jgi:hypothetical protein
MFADSHRAEQLSLYSQQRIVPTVEDSVLRTEMAGLESQEEDVPKRILFFKPMTCTFLESKVRSKTSAPSGPSVSEDPAATPGVLPSLPPLL